MDMQQRQLELAGPLPALAPSGRLRGRVCLVVGATSGIGRATALRMAEEGASFGKLMSGPAAKEAFTAFMEKRKPDFSQC